MSEATPFLKTPAGRFLTRYAVLLAVGFTLLSIKPVNDHVVEPYTEFVAHESKVVLRVLGEQATVRGVVLASPRFAVTIYNGCNGLEAILVFLSGVLAFPAPWRSRLIGAVAGLLIIQVVNVVRIISLFYIGLFRPAWFSTAHVFVWQTLVVLLALIMFLVWVHVDGRFRQSQTA